jgi:hypothetical protein
VAAEALTMARGPESASAGAEEDVAAVAGPAAGCAERGAMGAAVELWAASVGAGPAVAVEAGLRAGRPAVARIADHQG